MKKVMIIKDCELENEIKEEDFDYYDSIILRNRLYEKAVAFFEKNYSEYNTKYFDIVDIPKKATDVMVIDSEDGSAVMVVIDGKIETIYDNRGE
jgi:hypothetical protein